MLDKESKFHSKGPISLVCRAIYQLPLVQNNKLMFLL